MSTEERFLNTAAGCVGEFLLDKGEATTIELEQYLGSCLGRLRQVNGRRYSVHDPSRIVRGLRTVSCFIVSGDIWSVNILLLERYKEKKLRVIQRTTVKESLVASSRLPVFRKGSENKYVRYVDMLEGFSKTLQEDNEFSKIFKAPLKKLKGTENYSEAIKKVDANRLIGIIQGYEVTEQYCKEYSVKLLKHTSQEDNYQVNRINDAILEIYERIDSIESAVAALRKSDN